MKQVHEASAPAQGAQATSEATSEGVHITREMLVRDLEMWATYLAQDLDELDVAVLEGGCGELDNAAKALDRVQRRAAEMRMTVAAMRSLVRDAELSS